MVFLEIRQFHVQFVQRTKDNVNMLDMLANELTKK